jgi:CarD family transcriptional regulator
MSFEVGDRVVHPIYGVGTVKTVSAQSFGEGGTRPYYEVATGDATTVWVPFDGQGTAVLRRVASRHSLGECRRLLSSNPVALDGNHHLRQLEIATRLKGGLLPALCEMVRDLRARSERGPLAITEERVLRKIFKALCDEWAAVEGVSAKAAVHEIEDLLRDSRGA